MSQFLKNEDIKGQNLLEKTKGYMVDKFNQISKMFSYSSSLGQIFLSLSNHTKLVMYYIKDSANETSFKTARRKDSIFGMAQIQGHNAHRGIGATGVITLTPKKDVSFVDVPNKLYLPNFTRVICKDNNIMYYVSLGREAIEYDTRSAEIIQFNVQQGEMKTESHVGTGGDNQMYTSAENNVNVDMNHILVEVNGVAYDVKNSFAEFGYGGKCCIVRTGLSNGIDIIFGKSIYGSVPPEGSNIVIYYPLVVGSQGNRNFGLFEMVDPMFSAVGEDYNIKDYFDLTVVEDFKFGADAEDVEMTRLIAPNVNKNRIIHDKKSTKYFFDKTNLFAKVDVFNDIDNSLMETFLYPNLEDKVENGKDIFSMSREDILFDQKTKDRLKSWADASRSQCIDIRIQDPIIKQYAILIKMGVLLSEKDDINIDELKKEKRRLLNIGLSKFENTNRISKSDIIKMVCDDVESVNVYFNTEESSMIDELGDIIVGNKEIALPIAPFVSYTGDDVLESLNIEITYV